MNKRFEWIDVMRGIGILLVVIGHSGIPQFLQWWIWSFHMPLFFFISGLLAKPALTSFSEFFTKRIKGLVIPYLLYSFLILILQSFLKSPVEKTNVIDFISKGWDGLALWFIPVLFMSEISWFYISRVLGRKGIILSIIAASIAGYFLSVSDVHLPYKVEVVFTSLFYYGTGALLGNQVKNYAINNSTLIIVLGTVAALTLNLVSCFANSTRFDMCYNVIGNFYLGHLAALAGIGFVYFFSVLLSERIVGFDLIIRILTYFGRNTLIILLVHQLLKVFLIDVYSALGPKSVILLISRHVVFWVLLLGIIEIINRYFYHTIGRTTRLKSV